ncbi:hypothetical protein QTP86_012190 [Hemibagrus guttatus]|nr:hypothetical protein QTP86_012190 [Hemibagrus guttatus]
MSRLMKSFFLVLLVSFVFASSSEAKKKTKQKSGEDKTLSSGELSTKNGDSCTWQTREGKNNMVLQLKCSTPSEEVGLMSTDYECQFTGKPNECPAYGDKPAQYWKQVLGKLKKRRSACEGGKTLRAQMCHSAPNSAHMKLVREKTTSRKEGEKEEKKEEEMMMGDEGMSDGVEETESYCAEGWDPLCHLLTKLLVLHQLKLIIMPVDMAVQLYITHSPPLHSFLSSYEDYRVRNLINFHCKPLRPCINTKNTHNTSPNLPHRTWQAPQAKAKKKVVFADSKGMSLTAVRVFSPCENKKSNMLEQFHIPKLEGALNPVQSRILEFRQPAAEYVDFRNRLMKNSVCLESCTLQGRTLTGTVKVQNLSFKKSVHVRITFDSWKSHRDVECTFMNDVCRCRDTDTFSFVIEIPARVPPQDDVEFCVSYTSAGENSFELHSVDLELETFGEADLRPTGEAGPTATVESHAQRTKDMVCPGFVHSGAGVPHSLDAAAAEDMSQAPGEDLSPSATTHLRDLDPEPLRSPSQDGMRRGDHGRLHRLVPAILKNNIGAVFLHAGTNDIRLRQTEILKKDFRSLVELVRTTSPTTRIIVSGPLPTFQRGIERLI